MEQKSTVQHEKLMGHPVGLYTLFFAEMWERFSYYGMRALLQFYMIKGFLGMSDNSAYGVYGAYTALVYATPFIGGMLADRLLGMRRAVVFGGLLMAAGHLLMTVQHATAFYLALALLIMGNGFFKPNISTIVGSLYPAGSPRRDGGFTIFYMGINLGAAMSPLLCGYVGEVYGWHNGFGLATIGMLTGVAVFVVPNRINQVLILVGALVTAGSLVFISDSTYQLLINLFVGLALVLAAVISFIALSRGGIPAAAGEPPNPIALARRIGPLRADVAVYLGVLLCVPILAILVRNYQSVGLMLSVFGFVAFAWLIIDAARQPTVDRERLFVVLILMIFSMSFWAFFEQAGSSLNNFADRNVDRVLEDRVVTEADVGTELRFRVPVQTNDPELAELPLLSQEQLGQRNEHPEMARKIAKAVQINEASKDPSKRLTLEQVSALVDRLSSSGTLVLTGLVALRDAAGNRNADPELRTIAWRISSENVGMGIGGHEIPASLFQAANPIYILVFGILFTMLWAFLGKRGLDPSTPIKFALGLLQLALGFAAFWYGAELADDRGMIVIPWLLLGYVLHTTGELCLSPVGLSMVTKLSPHHLVSTVMGAWFLAMAFSNYLAGRIAQFTGLEEEGGPQIIPQPSETINLYGDVYGLIAVAAVVAAIICLALSPLLTKWMHREVEEN